MNVPLGSPPCPRPFLTDQLALAERRLGVFTVAMAAHDKTLRERVDRLGADAVQADAELEHFIVVFRARY